MILLYHTYTFISVYLFFQITILIFLLPCNAFLKTRYRSRESYRSHPHILLHTSDRRSAAKLYPFTHTFHSFPPPFTFITSSELFQIRWKVLENICKNILTVFFIQVRCGIIAIIVITF